MRPETIDALVYLIAYLILNPNSIHQFRDALEKHRKPTKPRRKPRRKKRD